MLRLADAQVSAIIWPDNLDTIHSFEFKAQEIGMTTGYSVFDWKRLFETGDQNREPAKTNDEKAQKKQSSIKPMHLPFAHVGPLKIKVVVQGDVVGTKGTTLHVDEFKGKETTTQNDLIKFYAKGIISHVPGVVTDADVLGFNVGDTAATYVGTAAGAGALGALGGAAMPAAGVLGVVGKFHRLMLHPRTNSIKHSSPFLTVLYTSGFDGIRHAMNAGKKSRGADADAKYKVGDFFRGVGQVAKDATKDGAEKRGKKADEKANAIDWAVGASTDLAGYTSENKARLGGAGAGVAGFAAGMALGGPIGAVAGAIIANKTTSATIGAVDRKMGKKKRETA